MLEATICSPEPNERLASLRCRPSAGATVPRCHRLRRPMTAVHALLLCIAGCVPAASFADTLLSDLQQRLATGGADQVNAYLGSNGASLMAPLNQRTMACDLQAVSLSMQLSRGSDG